MNCSNPSPENDKKDVYRSAYHKRYYAGNRERILARQKRWRTENPEAIKARNRRWYENNKKRPASSRNSNRERLNDYWKGYYAKNKKQIDQLKTSWAKRKTKEEGISRVLGCGTKDLRNESSSLRTCSYTFWNININSYVKEVRANCFCASLLRTQIHLPRHASNARAKY